MYPVSYTHLWPSDFTEITSWFGNRPYPGAGGSTNHGGLDIGASMGSNVYAALGGTITSSGWNGGYGNAITIDHGNGLSTLYGHMSQLIAGVGQMVAPGQEMCIRDRKTAGPSYEIEFDKYRKAVSVEAIQRHGFDQAVVEADEILLKEIQKGLRTRFFTFLATGTGTATGVGFQGALAQAWGQVQSLFEDDEMCIRDRSRTQTPLTCSGTRFRFSMRPLCGRSGSCTSRIRRTVPKSPAWKAVSYTHLLELLGVQP